MKKILTTIKNNIVLIIMYIIVISLLICEVVELDYSIYAPGGIVNITDRIENKQYDSKGSFNMTYVKYRKGTLFNLIIAKILPYQDIVKNEDITLKNEDIDDSLNRSELLMKYSISIATKTAYTKANKEIKDKDYHLYILFVDEDASSELKTGDEVIKCNNEEVNSFDDLNKCVAKYKVNEDIRINVKRKGKEISTKSKKRMDDKIGINIVLVTDYDKNPNIEFKPKSSEVGSSAGLMLTLSMYNALVEEDITKGMTIAGTGTIEEDGSIGEIDGIKYKIKGAAKSKVDLFIVPEANYDEAEQVIKDNNLKLKLLKASTFDQVLEDLKNYN